MYTTTLLTPDTWDDFAALVEANNGVWGGCWCIGFHPDGFHGREGNREAKRAHAARVGAPGAGVRQRRVRGLVPVRVAGRAPQHQELGGVRARSGRLPDWRVGCIFTGSKHRGHGVARAAVAGALAEIRAAGGGVVEAYPEQTEDRKPQRGAYLHTGPEELYTEFGFVRDRKIAKWRWVMRAEL